MLGHWELVVRLLIAAGLGSLIGAERERLIWAAGLCTHMLVCVGSCLFMVVSAYGFSSVIGPGVILDPSRVAAQVVTGIGFLGAGFILLRGGPGSWPDDCGHPVDGRCHWTCGGRWSLR